MTQGETPSPGSADLADLSLRGRGGKGHLIIIGASARAAAQSAIRAGYSPWCIDLFADRDLQAIAPVKRCLREKWPEGILELMHDAPPGPVLFTGAMETHLESVWAIEQRREVLGPSWQAMVPVRAPGAASAALRELLAEQCGWSPACASSVPAVTWEDDVSGWSPERFRRHVAAGVAYLVKPRDGAAGRGIHPWSPGCFVDRNHYVQRRLRGRALSGVLHAHAGQAVLIGVTEQIIGDAGFHAPSEFAYVGSLFPARESAAVARQFERAGEAVARWSGIEGVFGIDAVLPEQADVDLPLNASRIHIVEINPRYPASAELLERSGRCAAILDPLRAAASRWTPQSTMSRVFGKAVVFSSVDARVPDSSELQSDACADVPAPGAVIGKNQPVCTVFAAAEDRDACYAGLRAMAEKVYTRLQPA